MDKKIDFLYASISDIQSTIRSIDVKSGFMFVLLFTPIYNFDKTSLLYRAILNKPVWFHCAVIINILIWLLAITSLLMSVVAIANPSKHVSGASEPGSFYGGDLFSLSLADTFINFRNVSARSVQQEISKLPEKEENIIHELTFEKIKLSYIRAIKTKRFTFCIYSTFLWIFTGMILYIFYL